MKNKLIITIVLLLTDMAQPLLSQTPDQYFSLRLNSDAFAGMEVGYVQNPGVLKEKNTGLCSF